MFKQGNALAPVQNLKHRRPTAGSAGGVAKTRQVCTKRDRDVTLEPGSIRARETGGAWAAMGSESPGKQGSRVDRGGSEGNKFAGWRINPPKTWRAYAKTLQPNRNWRENATGCVLSANVDSLETENHPLLLFFLTLPGPHRLSLPEPLISTLCSPRPVKKKIDGRAAWRRLFRTPFARPGSGASAASEEGRM